MNAITLKENRDECKYFSGERHGVQKNQTPVRTTERERKIAMSRWWCLVKKGMVLKLGEQQEQMSLYISFGLRKNTI